MLSFPNYQADGSGEGQAGRLRSLKRRINMRCLQYLCGVYLLRFKYKATRMTLLLA
jgi:hypothetical protein